VAFYRRGQEGRSSGRGENTVGATVWSTDVAAPPRRCAPGAHYAVADGTVVHQGSAGSPCPAVGGGRAGEVAWHRPEPCDDGAEPRVLHVRGPGRPLCAARSALCACTGGARWGRLAGPAAASGACEEEEGGERRSGEEFGEEKGTGEGKEGVGRGREVAQVGAGQ
jgi:hypothetical protein